MAFPAPADLDAYFARTGYPGPRVPALATLHAITRHHPCSIPFENLDVLRGIANYLLCHLPEHGPDPDTVVRLARAEGLFLRDAVRMGARLGPRAIRLAVKDAATNARMIDILRGILFLR